MNLEDRRKEWDRNHDLQLQYEKGKKLEYSEQEQLKQIKNWDIFPNKEDQVAAGKPMEFLNFIEEVWNKEVGTVKKKGKRTVRFELHTGGWSGNEEIMSALRSSMFWILYWMKSERGGHYYFTVREFKDEKRIQRKNHSKS